MMHWGLLSSSVYMHTYPLLPASNSISYLFWSFWAPSLSAGIPACGAIMLGVSVITSVTITYYCTDPVCSSLFCLLLLSWHTSTLKTNCALFAEQCHINYWLKVVGMSKPSASVIQQNPSQPFMLFYKGWPLVKCDQFKMFLYLKISGCPS